MRLIIIIRDKEQDPTKNEREHEQTHLQVLNKARSVLLNRLPLLFHASKRLSNENHITKDLLIVLNRLRLEIDILSYLLKKNQFPFLDQESNLKLKLIEGLQRLHVVGLQSLKRVD